MTGGGPSARDRRRLLLPLYEAVAVVGVVERARRGEEREDD